MLSAFIKLLNRSSESERREGYAYVAGELLSGRMTPEQAEARSDDPWTSNAPFDQGMRSAAADWTRRDRKLTEEERGKLIESVLTNPGLYVQQWGRAKKKAAPQPVVAKERRK